MRGARLVCAPAPLFSRRIADLFCLYLLARFGRGCLNFVADLG
jgi:hypothetical protein